MSDTPPDRCEFCDREFHPSEMTVTVYIVGEAQFKVCMKSPCLKDLIAYAEGRLEE